MTSDNVSCGGSSANFSWDWESSRGIFCIACQGGEGSETVFLTLSLVSFVRSRPSTERVLRNNTKINMINSQTNCRTRNLKLLF